MRHSFQPKFNSPVCSILTGCGPHFCLKLPFTLARQAFRSMSSLQLQPNEVTHTALLRAFLQAKQLPEAERLADRRLNLVGYTLLLDAYARSGKKAKAELAFQSLCSKGLVPNLATYTALMKAYAKARDLQGAEAVMRRLQDQGLEPDVRTYLTLISAHAQAGSLARAEELFKEQGQPSMVSATALISAYGR
ncbi:unnamed protein product, partial [Effrenium voratum]